ncbi:hypothetical protein EVJ58_g6774 [Rhodofomes roseus]|nr:hypothetical protein EVJ58_g6774 [Rhodofomes roseus]
MAISSAPPRRSSVGSQAPKTTYVPNLQPKSIAAVSKRAVVILLQRLQIDVPQYTRDSELERDAVNVIREWGPDVSARLRKYLPPAIILTTTCYRHIADHDTKLLIVLFSALVISLDDPEIFDASGCRDLHKRLCNGEFHRVRRGGGGVLGMLMDVLSGMDHAYPAFPSSAIISAVLGFVNGCVLEQMELDSTGTAVAHCLDALPFLAYRRSMSGLADAFSYFIWTKMDYPDVARYLQAIPDISCFQNHANDVLSFYKEELAGETGNYVSDRARACGKSREATLLEIVDETVMLVTRIRRILGDGPVRDAWESFAEGWLAFHVCSPRYKLRELINCEYVVVGDLGI